MTLKRRQFTRKFKLQVFQYARTTAHGFILPSCSETTADGALVGLLDKSLDAGLAQDLMALAELGNITRFDTTRQLVA